MNLYKSDLKCLWRNIANFFPDLYFLNLNHMKIIFLVVLSQTFWPGYSCMACSGIDLFIKNYLQYCLAIWISLLQTFSYNELFPAAFNEIWAYNHFVRKRTFNHLAKLAKLVIEYSFIISWKQNKELISYCCRFIQLIETKSSWH